MIIDAHAHLDSHMLRVEQFIQKMDANGIDKVALIASLNDPLPETPELLLSIIRKVLQSKLTRPIAQVIHRSTMTFEGDLRLHGKTYQIYHKPDNATVISAIQDYPDRFLGWIFLNPKNNPKIIDELEYWRAMPKMIGVKFHPHWHNYRTEIMSPILNRIKDLKLPVLIHLGFGKQGDFGSLIQNFPQITFIFAHAGVPFYKELWKFSRSLKNVYVDLSSPYLDESLARYTVQIMGVDKCIYGTDCPYGFPDEQHTYNYEIIKGWIERMPIKSQDIDKLLGENFLKIIG
ncbi:MAG: amidohydrolase [Desulfobacterales bacterium]|nr:amidohydrolase [Desulfobacterales bacterium]